MKRSLLCLLLSTLVASASFAQETREQFQSHNADQAPETMLAAALGGEGHHWHYVDVDSQSFTAVDSHRATNGSTPNSKRANTVVFFARAQTLADGSRVDYTVAYKEFDCTQNHKQRTLAAASYVVGEPTPVAFASSATAWETLETHSGTGMWVVSCDGAPRGTELPGNTSFDEFAARYRDQL